MDTTGRAYFDHAATTPLDDRVFEAMAAVLRDGWGNPSGIYREAQRARGLLDEAQDGIAEALACSPSELVLTSGRTESDNTGLALAIRGAALVWAGVSSARFAPCGSAQSCQRNGLPRIWARSSS